MRKIFFASLFAFVSVTSVAQDKANDNYENDKGFKKENLFTGGGIDFGISTYNTVLGINPVLGYSVNKWLDAGIAFNFTYSSDRYYDLSTGALTGEKLHQTIFGPGAFVRLYPVNFLFVQAQFEENFIDNKDILPTPPSYSYNTSAPSLLLGAGYCSGRQGGSGYPFFYLSVMVDVLGNPNSPYVEQPVVNGAVILLPIVKGGIQIPLFQGHKQSRYVRHSRNDD